MSRNHLIQDIRICLTMLRQDLTHVAHAMALMVAFFVIGCGGDSESPSAAPLVSADDAPKKQAVASDPVESIDAHSRMVERLKEIHHQNQNNPYFEGALDQAQRKYDLAQRARNPYQAISALYDLGKEWTQKGDPDRGLEVLEELDSMLQFVKASRPDRVDQQMEVAVELARAIAALRKGENENCVHCLGGEGCLFPIGPGGVHRSQEGSQAGIKFLNSVLEKDPGNLTAIWLLNIAHMTLGTHPDGVPLELRLPEDRLRSAIDFPRFKNISSKLNLDTLSHAGGVVAEDFDGDLDLDIFVSSWATDGQCRYFRNDGDDGFSDQTESVGLVGIVGGLNTRQIDFDNDGDPDILILRGAWLGKYGRHPNSLLRNDGGTAFVDVSYDTGIAGDDHPTQAAAIADYDLDGDLDIFVGNENEPDQLLRNEGGTFVDVAKEAGLGNQGFAKGAAWGDVDNDGDPDLFVSNMGQANVLYQNLGEGKFATWDDADIANPKQSFSCWFFDYNNDGNLDLFVAAYGEGIDQVAAGYFSRPMPESDHDRLFRGNGDGSFTDVTKSVGLGRISQTMGSNFGDLNNDGYLDFYLATGSPAIEALQPNLMYLNQKGERFVDVSIAGGFSHLQKGHAIDFADFDHDGNQDVFAELGGAYQGDAFQNALFHNPGFDSSWIKMRLVGTECIRTAVGARIEVVVDGPTGERSIHRVVDNGSSFGSNPLQVHIGIGDAETVVSTRVRWPGTSKIEDIVSIQPNRAYQVVQGEGKATPVNLGDIQWSLDDDAEPAE